MNIEFEKPITPNFIRTDKGVYKLSDLTEEEFERYLKKWNNCMKRKYQLRIGDFTGG